MLSDYMANAIADVAAFKKEHGLGWQHELMKKVIKDCKIATTAAKKKTIKQREKLKFNFEEPYKQTRTVFDSMPAPNDSVGLKEYKKNLAKVQGVM